VRDLTAQLSLGDLMEGWIGSRVVVVGVRGRIGVLKVRVHILIYIYIYIHVYVYEFTYTYTYADIHDDVYLINKGSVKGTGWSVKDSHIFDDASALSDALSDCESIGSIESMESMKSGAPLSAVASMGYLGVGGSEGNRAPLSAGITAQFSLVDLISERSNLVILLERISVVLRRTDENSLFAGYHCSVLSQETSVAFKVIHAYMYTYLYIHIFTNICKYMFMCILMYTDT
jgi:hypothetical protein